MFDATSFPPHRPDPRQPRPVPLDTRALLPMLKAQAAEASLEYLAAAVGANAVTLLRWLHSNDLTVAEACAEAGPASPVWQLAEAQSALATACWRYRLSTGNEGLALVRRLIEQAHGPALAEYALRPLIDTAWPELDDLIAGDTPETLPPEPEPTAAQRAAGARAIAAWLLSDPRMDGLEGLLAAYAAEQRPGSPGTTRAAAAVRAAIDSVLEQGVELDTLQSALHWWSLGSDGPRIVVSDNHTPDWPTAAGRGTKSGSGRHV